MLRGPWDLSFPPNLGAPPRIQVAKLESWTASANEGMKFFSGTATYTKGFEAPRPGSDPEGNSCSTSERVKDIAEVSLNGRSLGILWKPPYRVDVTGVLRPGANQLQIKVTNQWTNRVAGDRLLPAERKILTPLLTFGQPPGALASGLLGPVTLVATAHDSSSADRVVQTEG